MPSLLRRQRSGLRKTWCDRAAAAVDASAHADSAWVLRRVLSRDANLEREVEAKEKSGTSVGRSVSRFARVPLGWRPQRIEAEESAKESSATGQSPI
jgi:hypothetical protein